MPEYKINEEEEILISASKKLEADNIDEILMNARDEFLQNVKKRGYFKRLLKYNRPFWLVLIGL